MEFDLELVNRCRNENIFLRFTGGSLAISLGYNQTKFAGTRLDTEKCAADGIDIVEDLQAEETFCTPKSLHLFGINSIR
jgi:hypothetical protein